MTDPTDPNTVTRDEQVTAAKELGFEPTQTWVLANPPKKTRSPAAERVKKSRELAKKKGLAQLNVSMPESLHGFVRELAKRTRAGASLEVVVADLMPSRSVPMSPTPAQPITIPKPAVIPSQAQPLMPAKVTDLPVWPALPAWKRWLVGHLLRSKS